MSIARLVDRICYLKIIIIYITNKELLSNFARICLIIHNFEIEQVSEKIRNFSKQKEKSFFIHKVLWSLHSFFLRSIKLLFFSLLIISFLSPFSTDFG